MLKLANAGTGGRARPLALLARLGLTLALGAATELLPGAVPLAQAQSGPQSITYNCTHNPEGLSLPTDARDVIIEAQGAAGNDMSGTGGRGMVLRGVFTEPPRLDSF